ncbi:hypothetical protein [Actinoallomurus acaciae]|uniref:Uncharacterized protein n=1 Tax=Actinoallomurus acaciae TaxID=502577 RepID=A0ABV5YCH9_9ACTN
MSIFTRRRRVRLSRHRTAAGPFGPVRISRDRRPSVLAHVEGPGIPAVTVLPGRDLSVNGERAPTGRDVGRWWDPRRKARTCTARVGDRGYELRPTGLFRARLLRDGTPIATAHGGLRSYSPVRSHPGIDARLDWSSGADPTDVAVGQAMVIAFGAGAPGALTRVLLFWLDV